MTDKEKDNNEIENEVLKQLESLKDADTAELSDADPEIPQFKGLLSELNDNDEINVGTEIGHWKVIDTIGQGGMSCVYLVERNDGQIQQQAALKVIPTGMVSQQLKDRFLRERQILTDLNHPNIAKLYDAGITDSGVPWFVMEYVQGQDIIGFAESNKLNIEQRVVLFRQVCEALSYSHSKGIVHRDIKPTNIIVGGDKTVKLLDFGIAASDENESLTMTGAVVGTPGYLSPEQAKGLTHQIDRRSDIFSVGVLLYKLIKKDMPFKADSISEISYKIINDEPTLLGNEISADLQAIIFKCLEKKVENRYSSTKNLSDDIDAYLNGDVISARKITPWLRFSKKIKKHPVTSKLIIGALIVSVIGVSYGLFQSISSLKKVQAAKEYMTVVQDIKGRIRRTHLLPLHNVQEEYKQLSAEIEDLRIKIEAENIDDSGLSEFALGSAYFNMKNFKKALEYFQISESKGWKSNELSTGLGFSLLIQWDGWHGWKKKAKLIKDKQAQEEYIESAKKESYYPAIEYLKSAQANSKEGHYLAARLAYINKEYDKALEHAETEININPWHYEALRLSSEIYLFKFKSTGQTQGYDVATKYLDLSNQMLEKSIEIGRSDPYNYTSRCTNASIDIQIKKMFKLDDQIDSAFEKGVEYCQGAILLMPDAHSPWASLNILYTTKAAYLESKGESALEIYKQSLKIIDEGLKVYPKDPTLLGFKIKPLSILAEKAIKNESDPMIYFKQALNTANDAIQEDPENSYLWSELANIQLKLGDYYLDIVKNTNDARSYYQSSIESYQQNLKLGNTLEAQGNIAVVQYKLMKILLSENNPQQAMLLFQESISNKIKSLPMRKTFITKLIDTLSLQKELIDLQIRNKSDIENTLKESVELMTSICNIAEISEQQKLQVSQMAQSYIENQWLKGNIKIPCKMD